MFLPGCTPPSGGGADRPFKERFADLYWQLEAPNEQGLTENFQRWASRDKLESASPPTVLVERSVVPTQRTTEPVVPMPPAPEGHVALSFKGGRTLKSDPEMVEGEAKEFNCSYRDYRGDKALPFNFKVCFTCREKSHPQRLRREACGSAGRKPHGNSAIIPLPALERGVFTLQIELIPDDESEPHIIHEFELRVTRVVKARHQAPEMIQPAAKKARRHE